MSNPYDSPLKCPNCGSQQLSSDSSVSIGMIYDPSHNNWIVDVEGFDIVEARREAYELFDSNNDAVCSVCAFDAPIFYFHTALDDKTADSLAEVEGLVKSRDERVQEFRRLVDPSRT